MSSKRNNIGSWTSQDDGKLRDYVNTHRAHHWDTIARNLGIGRSGNSCRLRWYNYLSPHIRRGEFTEEEKRMILKLRCEGMGWSKIARKLPAAGRTDNDIKNFWNTRVKKEAKQLNCDVRSEEFLRIMTARLTSTTAADPGGGDGVTDTSVADFFSTGASYQVAEDPGSIESSCGDILLDLGPTWSIDEIEAIFGTW